MSQGAKDAMKKHGGDIGILYRASYKLNTKTDFNASSFENCEIHHAQLII